jgi:hypothetical protein
MTRRGGSGLLSSSIAAHLAARWRRRGIARGEGDDDQPVAPAAACDQRTRPPRPRARSHPELGLEEAGFIDGDELVVDEADPMTLLELLNEDLFTGGLTETGFRSERKSTRA